MANLIDPTTFKDANNDGVIVIADVSGGRDWLFYDDVNDKELIRFKEDALFIGDGTTSGDKYLYANTGAANLPAIRYNVTSSKWEYSNDGTTFQEFVGAGGTFVEVIARQVSQVTVDQNGEVEVFSMTVPGGTLGTNRAIRVTAVGAIYNNWDNSRSVQIKGYYGDDYITHTYSNIPYGDYNRPLHIIFTVFAKNSTSAQVLHMISWLGDLGDAPYGGVGDINVDFNIPYDRLGWSQADQNSNLDRNLRLTMTLVNNSPSFWAEMHIVQVELL